jgi:D-glycero-alpha-D-manno-heptose-7-phosphate kinase
VQVHSSAPARLDLAGGTLDIWPLYLFHAHAQTLNAAISIRAHCTISDSADGAIHVVSSDTGARATVKTPPELDRYPEHRLVARLLQHFDSRAITVETRSDSPVGAGLAGSSALTIALCGALSRWHDRHRTPDELMRLAQNLEAQVIRVPTGAQDYRPAMYGGLAAIELDPNGVTRVPLRTDVAEFERRVVLAYSETSRDSGINNWEITKRHIDGDMQIRTLFDDIRDVAVAMRHALDASDWIEVGRQLQAEWHLRRQLAPGVTTPEIEALVAASHAAGAQAAKVCGAGGGGCVLLFADPTLVPAVRQSLAAAGGRILDFHVDATGLEVSVG